MKRVQLGDFEVLPVCFVSIACILVKENRGRKEHEPVVIDLASDSGCSSNTETTTKTEGM